MQCVATDAISGLKPQSIIFFPFSFLEVYCICWQPTTKLKHIITKSMAYARALSAFTIATVALIHRKFHLLLENCNLYLLCHALNISLPYTKALHMSSFIRVSEEKPSWCWEMECIKRNRGWWKTEPNRTILPRSTNKCIYTFQEQELPHLIMSLTQWVTHNQRQRRDSILLDKSLSISSAHI